MAKKKGLKLTYSKVEFQNSRTLTYRGGEGWEGEGRTGEGNEENGGEGRVKPPRENPVYAT